MLPAATSSRRRHWGGVNAYACSAFRVEDGGDGMRGIDGPGRPLHFWEPGTALLDASAEAEVVPHRHDRYRGGSGGGSPSAMTGTEAEGFAPPRATCRRAGWRLREGCLRRGACGRAGAEPSPRPPVPPLPRRGPYGPGGRGRGLACGSGLPRPSGSGWRGGWAGSTPHSCPASLSRRCPRPRSL